MTGLHKHHIVPKHAGGTDAPENLIELTVPEHAEAHRILWEQYGRIQDKVAWQMLSGQDTTTSWHELIRLANKGRKHTLEARQRMREAHLGKKHTPERTEKIRLANTGKHIHTDETKARIGNASRGRNVGRKHTNEEREKMREWWRKRKNELR